MSETEKTQGKLADGLFEELNETIAVFDDAIEIPTIIGVLEMLKHSWLQESLYPRDEQND